MKATNYKVSILLIVLICISRFCSGQDNNIAPKRLSFSASILAKKDLFYKTKTFENVNNLYKIRSKIQPVIAVNMNTRLLPKLSMNTGLQAATSNYSIKREYRSPELDYTGEQQFRLFNYKLLLNLQYEISKNLFIGGGIAFNHQRLHSIAFKSEFTALSGTYDITALDSTVLRRPVNTLSAQIVAQYRLSKRSSIIFQYDIDFGNYPPAHILHSINNNGNISNSAFKGSPHITYVALGYNILLF